MHFKTYQATVGTTGRVYKSDADNGSKDTFIGFAIDTATTGNQGRVQLVGPTPGFSGLTIDSNYYVQDAVGTIGTSVGTATVPVGRAITDSIILTNIYDT